MPELFDRPVVLDHQRNVGRPALMTVRDVHRPAEEVVREGRRVLVRERWLAVWRGDPDDVLQAWYPAPLAAETESPDG